MFGYLLHIYLFAILHINSKNIKLKFFCTVH